MEHLPNEPEKDQGLRLVIRLTNGEIRTHFVDRNRDEQEAEYLMGELEREGFEVAEYTIGELWETF